MWRIAKLFFLVTWFDGCVLAGDEWEVTAPSGKKVRIIVPEGAIAGEHHRSLIGLTFFFFFPAPALLSLSCFFNLLLPFVCAFRVSNCCRGNHYPLSSAMI